MIKLRQINGSVPLWVNPNAIDFIEGDPHYGTTIHVGDKSFCVLESAEQIIKMLGEFDEDMW